MADHKALVRNIFDRAASGYGEKGCSFFDDFGKRLVELANPSKGDSILDVATGKGAVLFPAANVVGEQGAAIGIDISPQMIEEITKKKPYYWIELLEMDAEKLVFPEHSFDIVFSAFALFFFPNPKKALSEFKKVLKPSGKLAVSTFGKKAALDLWISEKVKSYGVTSKLSTLSLDTPLAVEELLKEANYSNIELHEESKVFWHESGEDWWNSLWTHSIRFGLEQLSPDDLEKLKKEALAQAGTGRVEEERHAIFALATP